MAKLPKDLPTRKEWQQTRDQAGVKKGAVSKISMGDSIDKWHKARRTGDLRAVGKQSATLAFDAKAYRASLKDKDKKFGPKVETGYERPALEFAKWAESALKELKVAAGNWNSAFDAFVKDDAATASTLVPHVKAVVKTIEDNGLHQFSTYWLEVRKALNSHTPALAANQVGVKGKSDPLSGVNKPVQDFVRQNKL